MLSNRRNDERGAALIMVALTMVVLLGITAFVVDLGMGYNERRASQTSADAAALGGIQYIGISQAKATEEAIEVARESLRATYSDSDWDAQWATSAAPANGCPAALPSGYATFGPGTRCVMFNAANTRMRVRIPDQIIETAFGKVLGVNQLKAAAEAVAEVGQPGQGGVLPLGVLSTLGGNAQEICLKVGSGHMPWPCDEGNDNGNFGYVGAYIYGNSQFGTVETCSGHPGERLQTNIMVGIDHMLDEWQGPEENPSEIPEAARSEGCFIQRPNELPKDTGNTPLQFHGAIISLDNAPYAPGTPARLRQGDYPKRTITGRQVDNKPLWEFIDPTLTSATIPATCVSSSFTGANASKTHLYNNDPLVPDCFTDYNAGGYTVPLFTRDDINPGDGIYDIQLSPRFAFVPEFWDSDWASDPFLLKRFRPVFLQTVFIKCTGSALSDCAVVFNPGESAGVPPGGGADNSSNKAEAMSAMLFNTTMLPPSILSNGPGGSLGAARVGLIK
jgi:hypothetical protein